MREVCQRPGWAAVVVAIVASTWCATGRLSAQPRLQFEQLRREMVRKEIADAGVRNPRVLDAMRTTPRHEFVPLAHRQHAYFDMALPIGEQQTISSPFIVALMTESLDPQPTDKVLEIGTGSGYQAAVLSPLVEQVYTIEIVRTLGEKAGRALRRLDYDNVSVKIGDGFKGWPEHAPFDKIIVTCSPEKVPRPLVEQLREGGRMVIPVGERYQQTLFLFTKKDGKLESESLRPTLFVPMTGRAEQIRQILPETDDPRTANGDFEREPGESGQLPGWYYQRQLHWRTGQAAPEGDHFITFRNEQAGRGARALQGFGVDGRKVGRLDVSAWVRTTDVRPGQTRDMLPMIGVTFYDESRREVGQSWMGPWHGTSKWHRREKQIAVPIGAREGILRIGLFGAVGEASFDDVRMEPVAR